MLAGGLRPGLVGGNGFGLTNLHKSHPVHSCPVSALHTPCYVRGAAVFCGATCMASGGGSFTTTILRTLGSPARGVQLVRPGRYTSGAGEIVPHGG